MRDIRTKLTLWYSVTLAVILAGYSVGLYFFLKYNLTGELDRRLRVDMEAVAEGLQDLPLTDDGRVDWQRYREPAPSTVRDRWGLDVRGSDNHVIADPPELNVPPTPEACREGRTQYIDFETAAGIHLRGVCSIQEIGGEEITMRVFRSADRIAEELHELILMMAIAIPLGTLVSGVGGYLLARRALGPVRRMTMQAQSITADRLKERLAVENPHDELGQLASTFNQAFERIDRSFEQMKRFTSDASHELRTPLTAIRTIGEVALKEEKSDEGVREALASILEEADRLRHLTETLLILSRGDAGQLRLNQKPALLGELAKDVITHLGVLAEEKNQTIERAFHDSREVLFDRSVLRQAVINVIDNAIKYSPRGSVIRVTAHENAEAVWLDVKDQGPGIEAQYQEKIFERFFRVEESRGRHLGGAGLGLAIAAWAVKAHGGELSIASEWGKGSTFRICIPFRRV